MDRMAWINLAYLVGGLGFAMSLKWMSQAATARRGLLAGEIGFGIAIVATLFWPDLRSRRLLKLSLNAAAIVGSVLIRVMRPAAATAPAPM